MCLKNYKLVIFDLDGTLLDTLGDLAHTVNITLAQWNFPQHSLEKYRFFVGDGVYKLIERALPEDQRFPEMIAHVVDRFKINYFHHQTSKTKPYEGIVEVLDFLKQKGIRMAVASNKFHQASLDVVDQFFGQDYFDPVLGQRDGIPPKPDPRIVRDILEATDCSADETLFIGDSGVDIQTALASGCTPVGAAWGIRPAQELIDNGAIHILNHPLEIKYFFN